MVAAVIPDDILALIALVSVFVFVWVGHAKKLLLFELFAFLMLIIAGAWSFGLLPWFIPTLFLIGGLILFALDMMEGY
jgi:hypothetical protein